MIGSAAAAPVREVLAGWGRSPRSAAEIARPESLDEAAAAVAAAVGSGRTVLGRGLGRSYGDAGSSAGGLVVDLRSCDRLVDFSASPPVVTLEAGMSLDALLAWSVPRGLFVPVTPGTRQVTVAGAIAADVHGKNHHRDGSIGRFVRSLRLATGAGEVVLGPREREDAFLATIGGMGLTGLLLSASLELLPIETSLVKVDTVRTGDLDECMSLMEEGDAGYRYSVAWVDCLRRGRSMGRSVLTRGDHATRDDLGAGRLPGGVTREDPLAYKPRQLLAVPVSAPVRLATRPVARAFNEAWYQKAPAERTGELQTISSFFHPLDGVGEWNRLYGRRGFTQYQFAVPASAGDVVREVVATLSSSAFASLLVVLKRFGPASEAPLSFPAPGWTLALDIPLGKPGLADLLDRIDARVAEAGGRVYLAKDGRLRPDLVGTMYPRLGAWRAARDLLDPEGAFVSDLARRLHLMKGET